jgi:hypothetical protein
MMASTVVAPAVTARVLPELESTVTTAGLLERQNTAKGTGSEGAHGPPGGLAERDALSPTVNVTLGGETVIPWAARSHLLTRAVVAPEPESHAPHSTAARERKQWIRMLEHRDR